MENVFYGLALLQSVREAEKRTIWKEKSRRSEKELIIILTEAPTWVNKSEFTGKSEEPSIFSLQNGTAKMYSLKDTWKAISYMQLPRLGLHRPAPLAEPGDPGS